MNYLYSPIVQRSSISPSGVYEKEFPFLLKIERGGDPGSNPGRAILFENYFRKLFIFQIIF